MHSLLNRNYLAKKIIHDKQEGGAKLGCHITVELSPARESFMLNSLPSSKNGIPHAKFRILFRLSFFTISAPPSWQQLSNDEPQNYSVIDTDDGTLKHNLTVVIAPIRGRGVNLGQRLVSLSTSIHRGEVFQFIINVGIINLGRSFGDHIIFFTMSLVCLTILGTRNEPIYSWKNLLSKTSTGVEGENNNDEKKEDNFGFSEQMDDDHTLDLRHEVRKKFGFETKWTNS